MPRYMVLAVSVAAAFAFRPGVVFGGDPGRQTFGAAFWNLPDDYPPIRLIQFEEPAPEVTQPADLSAGRSSLAALSGSDSAFDNDFRLFEPPSLSSWQDTVPVPGPETAPGVTETAPLNLVSASTFSLVNLPDVAETIVAASNTPSVRARRRSPLSLEPRIRGYYGSQIYSQFDGAQTSPVRNDLDGVLSKVDPSLISSTQVISGPYGVRHGSGFAFFVIDSVPTPRYEDGRENHLRLGTHVRGNGGQTYNTATLLGGGDTGGYYVNLGYRKGSDYQSGSGLDIPSSYESLNLFAAYGHDIDDATRSETKFSFVDQGETEYAGQFFDVDSLKHHGITQAFDYFDDMSGLGGRVEAWYGNTAFNGDTDLSGKRRPDFTVLQRVDEALRTSAASQDPPFIAPASARFRGDVNGEIAHAGIRGGVKQVYDETTSLSGGADMRYVRHRVVERYDISDFQIDNPLFDTGLLDSEIFEPGLYMEFSLGVTDDWSIASGARASFASTQANPNSLPARSNFKDSNGIINRDLSQSDTLFSAYLTNSVTLTDTWSTKFGGGYAERIPDLTDRYSDGLFLSTIQSGFSRVIGNPELDKERNFQVDARLDGNWENVNVRLTAFHAWILDYNTYTANVIDDPAGARLLQAINTDYATLTGFEAYGEADLMSWLQTFGSLAYLEGQDREIDQPLAGISPLEARLGLRFSNSQSQTPWGLEWGWRIVGSQDRLASLRPVTGGGTTAIPLETRTPSFATSYLRGFLRPRDNISITGGIENMFDRNYFEHLSLRLPADQVNGFGETIVFAPGITPYVGIEIEY